MLLHCGPILYLNSSEPVPTNVAANATFGLVDTGRRKLMVTCHHVWGGFVKFQKTNPSATLAILLGENRPILLPAIQPIDSDDSLDIATFDMEPFLTSCRHRRFYPVFKNGVPPIRSKDILVTLGYLGEARHLSVAGADFRYEVIGVSVADVSGFRVCADMTKTRRYRDHDNAILPSNHSLGGLSGSPCYRIMGNVSLRLVGFVTSSALGLVRFTHVGCLNGDGTLNRLFMI